MYVNLWSIQNSKDRRNLPLETEYTALYKQHYLHDLEEVTTEGLVEKIDEFNVKRNVNPICRLNGLYNPNPLTNSIASNK